MACLTAILPPLNYLSDLNPTSGPRRSSPWLLTGRRQDRRHLHPDEHAPAIVAPNLPCRNARSVPCILRSA